jgi:hypothetical protein
MITTTGRPAGNRAADKSIDGGVSSTAILAEATDNRAAMRRLLHQLDLGEPMRRRGVQEAISQVQAWWWAMRAEHFDRARPRPDDYNGAATLNELAAANERCRGIAQPCRAKAALIKYEQGDLDDV